MRTKLAALAVVLAVGLVACGGTTGDDPQTSVRRPRSDESGPRPWTASERRYCPVAGLAMPMYVQYEQELSEGNVESRAAAVAALRQWNRRLRQAAPPEIAEAVRTLTAISDHALEVTAAETADAVATPTAERAYAQHSAYLRDHCGIDFGGS